MARIARASQVTFGTSGLVGLAGFGAAAGGNTNTQLSTSTALATIMGTTEFTDGWLAATLGATKFPAVEDMNALFYMITMQLGYMLQQGLAIEWDAGTTYYNSTSAGIVLQPGTTNIFQSLTNANLNNALPVAPASNTNWKFLGDLSQIANNTPNPSEQTITGNSHAFVSADLGLFTKRHNSAVAMTDTLPSGGSALANGWFAYIQNDDASASLTISSSGTINQGNLTGSVILLPGELWFFESQGSGVYNAQRISAATLHASPVGGNVKNFKSTYNSTTTATLSADEIVLEDANGNTRRITSVSQQYAVGTSGAGGIDTGTIAANTWYYEYLAFNPTTGAKTAFISLSATAPTLPSGYTFYKATGEMRTDGSSHIIGKLQVGKRVQYLVGSNLSAARAMISGSSGNVTTPTWTAQSVANYVPYAGGTAVRIQGYLAAYLASPSIGCIAAPNNSYAGSQTSVTNYPPCAVEGTSASGNGGSVMFDWVLESTNVYYASAATETALICTGWETNLI